MSDSQFIRDLAWAADTYSFTVHNIRLEFLKVLYPDRVVDIKMSSLPEDAFMVSGDSSDRKRVVWTALTELTERGCGVAPKRRDIASVTGLALMTVQKYVEELAPWLHDAPGRKDGQVNIVGSIYHIPPHVKDQRNLREFQRVVIMVDMADSPVYQPLIGYCQQYMDGRVYLGGSAEDIDDQHFYREASLRGLTPVRREERIDLLRHLYVWPETAVVTDDLNWSLLASGAGLAVFSSDMIAREFFAREVSHGTK